MTQQTKEQRYLTISDVASALHVSPRTVTRAVKDGRLPRPLRIGRCVRFRADDVREFLEVEHLGD